MSLILDALRKSEAERRRGEAPGLFTPLPAPGARPRNRSAIAPWLVAGAVLASAAVAWWQWPSTPPATPAPVVAPAAVVPTTSPTHASTAPSSAHAPTAPDVVAEPVKLAPAPVKTSAPIAADALPLPPPPALELPQEPPLESLPSLATLSASERAALPPLKLSMHVWSEAPNARLALIDGQRVMEGATLGEAIVAEIRRDGVVLEWRGRRFLLSRP